VRDDVAMIPDLEWLEGELLRVLADADLTEAPVSHDTKEWSGTGG
jgi:chemosensory pili system protein ChpC